MKNSVLLVSITLLLFTGFKLLTPSLVANQNEESEGAIEHAKKAQWMKSMLADPATGEIPIGARTQELQFYRQFQEIYPNANRGRGSWNFRGPHNVGGRTRGVAIDCINEDHILAASVSGGIWKTTDGGATWSKVSFPNDHPGVTSICQDTRPGKTNLWYAVTGEISGPSASATSAFYVGDGAFYSVDNGNTFKPIASTAGNVPSTFNSVIQVGWRIISSPVVDTNATCLYMATYGSIFRSVDTGKSWKVVLGSNNFSVYTDVAISSNGVVYAALSSDGTQKGFFRSADGVTFTNITPSYVKNLNRTVLSINPNNENEVYFLSHLDSASTSFGTTTTNYEGTPEYVSLLKYTYKSGDGSDTGGIWTDLSPNLPVTDPDQFDKFNCQGGYDLVVRVQPQTNHVVIGGTNLYISKDGFSSPNNTQQVGGYAIGTRLEGFGVYSNHHPDQHDILFFKSNPAKVLSASDGGIKITDNINAAEVVWQEKSIGYHTSQIYTVTIDQKNAYDQWVLTGLQDNGNYLTRTNDVANFWNMTINGDGAYNYIAPDKAFCVISTQLGNVRKVKLDEQGKVLQQMRIDPAGVDKNTYGFINCFEVDENNDNNMYMAVGKKIGVLKDLRYMKTISSSSKLEGHWVFSDTITTPNNGNYPAEITTLAVSKFPANVIYVGTSNKEVYRLDNPLSASPKLTKLGKLSKVPSDSLQTGWNIIDICIDPEDANKVFVVCSNYNIKSVFYSWDGGANWSLAGGNLEGNSANPSGTNPSIRCMNILKRSDGSKTYFLGTSVGLYSTDTLKIDSFGTKNLTVWKQESPELIGANVVTDIKVRNSDGYVIVGTHGNGIFDAYYDGKQAENPKTFISSSNVYPNPTMSDFYFTFNATKNSNASAYLLDMTGRKVRTVFNTSFNTGSFKYKVNVEDLQAGQYLLLYYPNTDAKPEVHRIVKL